MKRVFWIAIVCAASQLPVAADQYANVTEAHNIYHDRQFPGVGNIADWQSARQFGSQAIDFFKAKRYEDAIRYSTAAIKVYPFDPDFYNQLAVSLWQRKQPGDLELGISNVRKAIELDPNHCIYWDNLAKALAGINRTQEARDALAHAAHCPTTPEKLAEIQDNIRTLDNALAKQAASQQSNQLAPPNQ